MLPFFSLFDFLVENTLPLWSWTYMNTPWPISLSLSLSFSFWVDSLSKHKPNDIWHICKRSMMMMWQGVVPFLPQIFIYFILCTFVSVSITLSTTPIVLPSLYAVVCKMHHQLHNSRLPHQSKSIKGWVCNVLYVGVFAFCSRVHCHHKSLDRVRVQTLCIL